MSAVQIAGVFDLVVAAFVLVGTVCMLVFPNRKRRDKTNDR